MLAGRRGLQLLAARLEASSYASQSCSYSAAAEPAIDPQTQLQSRWDNNHAAMLHAPDDLRYEPHALPQTIAPNSVRVKMRAVGICGSDVHYFAKACHWPQTLACMAAGSLYVRHRSRSLAMPALYLQLRHHTNGVHPAPVHNKSATSRVRNMMFRAELESLWWRSRWFSATSLLGTTVLMLAGLRVLGTCFQAQTCPPQAGPATVNQMESRSLCPKPCVHAGMWWLWAQRSAAWCQATE